MVKPPLSYSELDTTIGPWAMHHGVHVYGRSQDEEVRVAAIVDDAGDTYHITVTLSDGGVAVDAALSQRAAGRVPCLSCSDESLFFVRLYPQGEVTLRSRRSFQSRAVPGLYAQDIRALRLIQPSNNAMELTADRRTAHAFDGPNDFPPRDAAASPGSSSCSR